MLASLRTLPSMLLGYQRDGGELVPVENDRRFSHTYVIGKAQTGKTSALIRWALDDIHRGEGVAFFDPRGDAAADLLTHIPPERIKDVVLFDPADRDFPVGLNPLHHVPVEHRPRVANAVLDTFKGIWRYEIATPQLDMFLYTSTATLLEVPDATLMGINYLLTSQTYRARVLSFVNDPVLHAFWTDFFDEIPDREQRQATMSTLNKVIALIADPTVRNLIGQSRPKLSLSEVVEQGKILIVSLPQGQLGMEKATLIGALMLSQLHLALLSRTSRAPFHLYLDNVDRLGMNVVADLLDSLDDGSVSVTLSHRYLSQLSDRLRDTVLGTVGTLVSFRIGPRDARTLAPEFELTRNDSTLVELTPHEAHVRADRTHPHLTMPRHQFPQNPDSPEDIRLRCRRRYATHRRKVEERIARFVENA
jgi:hypothetical protein